jgi:lysophospholipase L1-like esterase
MSSARHAAAGRAFALFFALALALLGGRASAATRYPEGAVQSPMTAAVVARLRAVLATGGGARGAFIKVGDSNTANPSFMRCLAGGDVRLGDHADLEATRAYFHAHRVDVVHDAFTRVSLAATAGWLTGQVLQGTPSHLSRELAAVKPAFAIVMLGTNDNRPGGFEIFRDKLADVVDRTLAAGVVPILSTLPPRDDAPSTSARVPAFNAEIRALAEARSVPLIDLNAALASLPRHGLARDGVHLAPAGTADGSPHPCWFSGDALEKGMNVRNLVTLVALDRARRFLLEGATPEVDSKPAA